MIRIPPPCEDRMTPRNSVLHPVLILAVAIFGTATSLRADDAAGALPQPKARTAIQLEGWTIRVDDRLGEPPHVDLKQRALRFLEAKLVEVKAVVPEERLKELRKVVIVIDLNCGKLNNMQYHPSAGWLKANGYPSELEKCVHIPKAEQLPTRRNINEQPWVILHELAHAFHDQQLGFDEPRVKEAFEKFKASGMGEKTLLYNGKRVKHYALTNHKEFFAEMTEAFFGSNDFFPFNRAELQEADPELHRLLGIIWNNEPREIEKKAEAAK